MGECMPKDLQYETNPDKVDVRRKAARAIQIDTMHQLVSKEESF